MHGTRLLALLTLSLAACAGGGEDDGGGQPGMLEGLGIPLNEVPRADAATVHPLGRETSVHLKKSELFLSGVATQAAAPFVGAYAGFAGRRQVLLDDRTAATPWAPLFASADETATTHLAAGAAGDTDGDGIEEALVLYYVAPTAYLQTVRRGAAGYEQSEAHALGTFSFTSPLVTFDNLQLAAGDLDGDGRDEVAAAIGATVLVLDDATTGYAPITSVSYRPGVAGQITTLAIGNVDADRDVELVVVNGLPGGEARYYVYSLAAGALVLDAGDAVLREAASLTAPLAYQFAKVAIGDLDGDNFNEVAFVGSAYASVLSVTVMKHSSAASGLATLTGDRYSMHESGGIHAYVPAAAVFDADGLEYGRRKELLAYRYILQLGADGALRHRFGGDGALAPLPLPYHDKMTVGDFNGDLRDEVAFVGGNLVVTTVYFQDHVSVWGNQGGTFQALDDLPATPGSHETVLCALNADGDSLVLRYTGEYELLYTRPEIVAVLASPPYYEGQDIGNAGTSIAWGRSDEDESGDAYGFYVGLSIGYQWEVPLIYEMTVTLDIDASYDWTFTTVRTDSQSKSFNAPAGEDQVIFAVTPHDVYYYEVVSSPQPEEVGTRYAIQLPRRPKIYPMALDRYNGLVDPPLRVPPEVIRHTLGDPWSYPTRADKQALFTNGDVVLIDAATGREYTNVVPISVTEAGYSTPDAFMLDIGGAAGGTQTIELSGGTTQGYGNDFDLQVGATAEYEAAGGLFVSGRAGFHYGYSRSFSTGEQTTITGTVPNLPASMAGKRPYSVGLFSYPYPNSTDPRFVVVDYWVEE